MSRELKILIVDDSVEKYQRVMAELQKRLLSIECKCTWADEYNSAVEKLKVGDFDIVILDLLLPIGLGTPSLDNSRGLVSMMMVEHLFPSPHVIGLTEHNDAAEGEQKYYAEHMFALEVFSWDNEEWADRIASKIRYLEKSKRASILYANSNYETDLLIISARYENEFKPILRRMKWESEPMRKSVYFPGVQCAIGKFVVDAGRSLRVTYMCAGEMGIASATALTSHAISVYRPRLVVALGMCCGFRGPNCASPTQFGDVLIARESASWEEGKYSDLPNSKRSFKTKAAIRTVDEAIGPIVSSCVEMSSDLIVPSFKKYLGSAAAKLVMKNYRDQCRPVPEIKYGLVVSGSSVVADVAQIEEIMARQSGAIGLEMEIFGIYTAVQKSIGSKKPAVLGIKGVADFGDGEKHDHIQAHASILSFYTMLALLRKLYGDGHLEAVQ